MYLATLKYHDNEKVFQAAQDLDELFTLFSSEIKSDSNDSMTSGSPGKQDPENLQFAI